MVTPCSSVDGYQCLQGPAASSSRPEKVTSIGPLGLVVLLTTTALTLPYVTDFLTQLTFMLKEEVEAACSFPLITLVTLPVSHHFSENQS